MKKLILLASFASVTFVAAPAGAQTLTYEGISRTYPFFDPIPVLNFYNGGTSGAGTTDPNYGISFSPNALAVCLNTISVTAGGIECSGASRGGLGPPPSQFTGLAFSEGQNTYMNRAAGFVNGFSFVYSALDVGTFWVWDGLNGTGRMLGAVVLPATAIGTCFEYRAPFCPFFPASVSFAGVARSATFTGFADQIITDDLTFTAARTATVPEPSSIALAELVSLPWAAWCVDDSTFVTSAAVPSHFCERNGFAPLIGVLLPVSGLSHFVRQRRSELHFHSLVPNFTSAATCPGSDKSARQDLCVHCLNFRHCLCHCWYHQLSPC